jgi:two-component system LytT family response regulator
MMIQAVIIDDEAKSRETLSKMLTKYCPNAHVAGAADSVESGFALIKETTPDLVFLDVEMPPYTGFDLMKKFDEIPFEVIFTTAFDKYALNAIKFCALDYLLKPIDIEELILAVDKMRQRNSTQNIDQRLVHLLKNVQSKSNNKIAIPTQEGLEFINSNEIVHCEAQGSYTLLVLQDNSQILSSRTLKEFEGLLVAQGFYRIHHTHLINLDYIQKYHKGNGGYVVMQGGASISVSRRKKDDFLKTLNTL